MSNHTHAPIRQSNTRFVKAIAVSLALLASLAAQAQTDEQWPQGPTNKPQAANLTRAEVIADLVLWRRAGVDQHQVAYSHQLETEAYEKAHQEYERLRHSEAYQIEVQKAQQE